MSLPAGQPLNGMSRTRPVKAAGVSRVAMHAPHIAGVALVLIGAMALAGCTGNFSVKQTEPFRVQIDGAPQQVVVASSDTEPKRVEVATNGAPQVNVNVQVQQVSATPCKVHVKVQDKDTGEVLEERDIDLTVNVNNGGGSATQTTTSSGNTSANGTTTVTETQTQTMTQTQTQASSGQVVVQNFVINVKGGHNVVVLTQALQGSANVNVQATTGNGQNSIGGSSSTDTATVSASASASMTNWTSDTNSTSGYP